jgi:hypothetical protein
MVLPSYWSYQNLYFAENNNIVNLVMKVSFVKQNKKFTTLHFQYTIQVKPHVKFEEKMFYLTADINSIFFKNDVVEAQVFLFLWPYLHRNYRPIQ